MKKYLFALIIMSFNTSLLAANIFPDKFLGKTSNSNFYIRAFPEGHAFEGKYLVPSGDGQVMVKIFMQGLNSNIGNDQFSVMTINCRSGQYKSFGDYEKPKQGTIMVTVIQKICTRDF